MDFWNKNLEKYFRKQLEEWEESAPAQLVSSVERAWEENRNHEFIILANVYFEAWVSSILASRWDEKDLSEKEREWLSNKSYGHKLNLMKECGLIDEDTHKLLKDLKDARNDYAHDFESLSGNYQTKIEREENLEDVYDLLLSSPANPNSVEYVEHEE